MTLIVESGSGLPDAESYASVATCDTYHSLRGNVDWTGTATEKEIALRLATQAVEVRYVGRWLGQRISQTMSLSWPRYYVYDSDGYCIPSTAVPQRIVDATCELALRSRQGDALVPDVDEPGSIASEAVTVGPISVSTSYTGGKEQTPEYSIVDGLIGPFVTSGGTLVRS